MKKYIYAPINNLAGFFGRVVVEDIEPFKYGEYISQSLYSAPEDLLKSLIEDDLYSLGSLDNVTGEITPAKEFICHIGEIALKVLKQKYNYGEKDESND